MNNKYRMREAKILASGEFVYRIQAISKFRDDVNVGDYGGWIQSEKNLSPDGSCWIFDNAMVINDAKLVHNATVSKNARVANHATVSGESLVTDNCDVVGHSSVTGFAKISGGALISGHAIVQQAATVYENAIVGGHCIITDTSKIYGDCKILGDSVISDCSELCGDVTISSPARISSYADIKTSTDYWFMEAPSLDGYITMYKCKPMTHEIGITYHTRSTGPRSFHSINSFERYMSHNITTLRALSSLSEEQLKDIIYMICSIATVLCGK